MRGLENAVKNKDKKKEKEKEKKRKIFFEKVWIPDCENPLGLIDSYWLTPQAYFEFRQIHPFFFLKKIIFKFNWISLELSLTTILLTYFLNNADHFQKKFIYTFFFWRAWASHSIPLSRPSPERAQQASMRYSWSLIASKPKISAISPAERAPLISCLFANTRSFEGFKS